MKGFLFYRSDLLWAFLLYLKLFYEYSPNGYFEEIHLLGNIKTFEY